MRGIRRVLWGVGGTMADKKPFYEVLSYLLSRAPDGIRIERLAEVRAAMVGCILDALYSSEMPATVAHKIAKDHENLPSLLVRSFRPRLAEYALRVLADLKSREDAKNEEIRSVAVPQ